MKDIKSLVSSISSYIDIYENEKLTKKQNEAIITARTVILESLKEIDLHPGVSQKRLNKMEKRLDIVFNKVITILSNDNIASPEILETIKNKQ